MTNNKRKRSSKNDSNKDNKRKKLENEDYLISALFVEKTAVTEKKAILVFGCPGSGKSNYIRSNKEKLNNYVKISRDYFIENNSEVNNLEEKWKILQKLVLDVEKKALDKNCNILWEVTGRNWSDIARIRKFCKLNSYNIKFIFISSDKDLCKNRVIFREKIIERKVSLRKFNVTYSKILDNYKRLKSDLQNNEEVITINNNWYPNQ